MDYYKTIWCHGGNPVSQFEDCSSPQDAMIIIYVGEKGEIVGMRNASVSRPFNLFSFLIRIRGRNCF